MEDGEEAEESGVVLLVVDGEEEAVAVSIIVGTEEMEMATSTVNNNSTEAMTDIRIGITSDNNLMTQVEDISTRQ